MKKNTLLIITIAALLCITHISCNKDTRVKEVIFPQTSLTLNVGATSILPVMVLPCDATDQTLNWSSSEPKVATVDNNGKITAIAEGIAVITAASNDGNRLAKCGVRVIDTEIEMIFVEGGTFTMGCTEGYYCQGDEFPGHQVTLNSFQISKYLVTQKLWQTVMGYNPSYFRGDNLPVEQVSWYDAQNFINKLNEFTGKNYCLPTEAQWEFAARGGNESHGYIYSGSDDVDAVAWYGNDNNDYTKPIGTKAPNELGIYDMSGNVYEWVNDWFESYTDAPQINPQGPPYGFDKVARGGAWFGPAQNCRVTYRKYYPTYTTYSYLGFRLALPTSAD